MKAKKSWQYLKKFSAEIQMVEISKDLSSKTEITIQVNKLKAFEERYKWSINLYKVLNIGIFRGISN